MEMEKLNVLSQLFDYATVTQKDRRVYKTWLYYICRRYARQYHIRYDSTTKWARV